jgi:outer membrane beta-barrel protein
MLKSWMKNVVMITLLSNGIASVVAHAQDTAPTSDKVDIKKLEDQYWNSKDDDFSVVQNRAYTKAKRMYLSAMGGIIMNDGFSTGRITSFSAGYFLNERYGLEFTKEAGSLSANKTTDYFLNQFGASPDYNTFENATGISGTFVPFYAKMSWLDKTVLYFDMSVSLGLGQLEYQVQTDQGGRNKTASYYSLDVAQHLFVSNNVALRLDLRNKWSNQEIYKYRIPSTSSEDSRFVLKQQQNDTTLLFGITYFH